MNKVRVEGKRRVFSGGNRLRFRVGVVRTYKVHTGLAYAPHRVHLGLRVQDELPFGVFGGVRDRENGEDFFAAPGKKAADLAGRAFSGESQDLCEKVSRDVGYPNLPGAKGKRSVSGFSPTASEAMEAPTAGASRMPLR